jgi:hypothetical protein
MIRMLYELTLRSIDSQIVAVATASTEVSVKPGKDSNNGNK